MALHLASFWNRGLGNGLLDDDDDDDDDCYHTYEKDRKRKCCSYTSYLHPSAIKNPPRPVVGVWD